MSRDIVDISTPFDWLVVAVGIEGEPADQLPGVGGDDPDVEIGDEELDRSALVGSADAPCRAIAMRKTSTTSAALTVGKAREPRTSGSGRRAC
jgi:hypothetical protein